MMTCVYLITWVGFIVAMNISGCMHDERFKTGELEDRKGFWEMLWFGCASIAAFQFFDRIL